MKILYGISLVGNGHISRAVEVVRHLRAMGHVVELLLSGGQIADFWDKTELAPYWLYRGVSFITQAGQVDIWQTLRHLKAIRFYTDFLTADVRGVDLIITDFEPISARLAQLHRIPSIGIGNQYVAYHKLANIKQNFIAQLMTRYFALVDYPLGLHWYHFDSPIAPPILSPTLAQRREVKPHQMLVYLPYNSPTDFELFRAYPDHSFLIYGNFAYQVDAPNIHYRPFSRQQFLFDLLESEGVISGAGFGFISEALHLGKKILVQPLAHHIEQEINGMILRHLQLGHVTRTLTTPEVDAWLAQPATPAQNYPNVAEALAEWVTSGQWDKPHLVTDKLWGTRTLHNKDRSRGWYVPPRSVLNT